MTSYASEAFVLDASVTATWLLPDEHTDASARAFARIRSGLVDVQAPDLWLFECANIIANSVRRKRVAAADAMLVWSVLDAVRSRVELVRLEPGQVRACLALSIELGLTVYDATYLWLASSLGLPLLTHDAALAKACGRKSVPVLRVEDLS